MPSTPNDMREIERLLAEMRNHLDAAERHHSEAERCRTQLAKLLPPDSPLLDLMMTRGSEGP